MLVVGGARSQSSGNQGRPCFACARALWWLFSPVASRGVSRSAWTVAPAAKRETEHREHARARAPRLPLRRFKGPLEEGSGGAVPQATRTAHFRNAEAAAVPPLGPVPLFLGKKTVTAAMAFARSPLLPPSLAAFLCLFLLPPGGFCEDCKAYKDSDGHLHLETTCPVFCCGSCTSRYCCSNSLLRFDENDGRMCTSQPWESSYLSTMEEPMKFKSDFDDWHSPGPSGTVIAIGVSIFILFIVTIIVCFTCSCCCLYKVCRREPRSVVTTTTATTVVQVPYPQQPAMSSSYPPRVYQGYNPVPVQPQHGMPVAPYPTQYPPPYPTQPAAPPAYHETMTAGAGAPPTQPPYNPAYMDPPKHSY